MNLLAQEGRSLTPGPSPLGAIGRAGVGTAQQLNRNKLLEAQIGLSNARAASSRNNPQNRNVQSTFQGANGNIHLVTRDGQVKDTGIPFNEKIKFVEQDDGSIIALDSSSGERLGVPVTPEQAKDATIRAVTGSAQAQAVVEQPAAQDKANRLLSQLDDLENHAGLTGAVGLKSSSSLFGARETPFSGTDEASFVALVDQVGGAVFLEAFQELKGGGHITEIEGQKAEQAVARIRNRSQGENAYKQAIQELREIIQTGLARRAKEAAGDFSPNQSGTVNFSDLPE
jgi:hypothetical protein